MSALNATRDARSMYLRCFQGGMTRSIYSQNLGQHRPVARRLSMTGQDIFLEIREIIS